MSAPSLNEAQREVAILRVLSSEPMLPAEVSEKVGVPLRTVKKSLAAMRDDGVVGHICLKGWYLEDVA